MNKPAPTPEQWSAAVDRLNKRQQARNLYTNIDRAAVLREIRRHTKTNAAPTF
jgi:hypothetical protein